MKLEMIFLNMNNKFFVNNVEQDLTADIKIQFYAN